MHTGLLVSENKIWGVVAPPRVSRNNNLYIPSELQRGDGMEVPFFADHEDMEMTVDSFGNKVPTGRLLPVQPRGHVQLNWNDQLKRLEFTGEVWDKNLIRSINSGERTHVSLAGDPEYGDTYRGMNVPLGLKFFSLSAVRDPGIPEADLHMEKHGVAEDFKQHAQDVTAVVSKRFVVFEGTFEHFGDLNTGDDIQRNTGQTAPWIPPSTEDPQSQVFTPTQQTQNNSGGTTPMLIPAPAAVGPAVNPAPRAPAPAQQVMEPLSKDAQTIMRSMKGTYDDPDKAKSVFYATMNKRGIDYTKPIAKQSMERLLRDIKAEQLRLGVKKEARAQTAPKSTLASKKTVSEDTVGSGVGVVAGAQDATVKQAGKYNNQSEKNIGMSRTPFERNSGGTINTSNLPDDTPPGNALPDIHDMPDHEPDATEEENTMGEEEMKEEAAKDASSGANPNSYANTLPRAGNTGAGGKMDDLDEAAKNYGYTKEDLEGFWGWSTLSSNEKKQMLEKFRLVQERSSGFKAERKANRLRESGVLKADPISNRRESKVYGRDITPGGGLKMESDVFGLADQNALYGATNEMSNYIRGTHRGAFQFLTSGPQGTVQLLAPMIKVPKNKSRQEMIDRQLKFNATVESYAEYQNTRLISEAISTTSTGTALGVDELTPALVIPTQTAGMSRDTVIFRPLPQMTSQSRLQTIQTPTMGALTENIQPSVFDPTLTAINVTTAPRGVLHQISFEVERKVIGPFVDGLVLADRIAELYDEDVMVMGTPNLNVAGSLVATGVTGGFENTTVVAANKFNGDATAYTNDASVTSGMTMTAKAVSFAQRQIIAQGYSPDNLIILMHPKPYADLLNDSNIVRYIQVGAASGDPRDALIAQGVIPDLFGFEIRRCTTVPQTLTGGSGGIPTYHAWCYKKGLSAVMSASRDVMIETFRDIRLHSTWISTHYDMGVAVPHPNSLVLIASA